MAYAGVSSLKQTINGLLNSCRISLISSTRETLELAYKELEDVLEFHELYSQEEDGGGVHSRIIETSSRHDHADVDFGVEMVGRSTEFNAIRDRLLGRLMPHDLCFFLFRQKHGCPHHF